MVRNVVFDMGGVIIGLDRPESVRRFREMGIPNAGDLLDECHQKGVFMQVEDGSLSAEEFRRELSHMAGKELSYGQVEHAWLGFIEDVPQYKLDYLDSLRSRGYKLYLLSNTNPYVMGWVRSPHFSASGRPLQDYMDYLFTSYEMFEEETA